jgi:hypothetical protein
MKYPLIHLLFIFLLCSCTSLKPIYIEVSQKPGYPLPERIQGIAILNRSITPESTNIKADSLENLFFNSKWTLDSLFRDETASGKAIESAANSLFGSGRFDVVIPLDRNIKRKDSLSIGLPLLNETIENYCIDFKVDAVLVLESFNEKVFASYQRIPQTEMPDLKKRQMKIVCNSYWNLYVPGKDLMIRNFKIADSLEWKTGSIYLPDLRYGMTNLKRALTLTGEAAGNKMAKAISPVWINKPRHYFATGKPQIDKAILLIDSNKWDEAAKIWVKYATVPSKTVRAKIEFNLALASEMFGKIDLAIEWCTKSYQSKYLKVVEDYLKILNLRKKEIEDEQLQAIF